MEIALLTAKFSQVECYLAKEDFDLSSPVLVKKIPEVIVCSMKRRNKSYDALFSLMPEIPEAACVFHKGSYDTFHRSYTVLLNYIDENGYEICGNIRESYIDGVWNKDSSEDWLTEIQIPVQKKFSR